MQFEVKLDNSHLLAALNNLTHAIEHPATLLHGIGAEVLDLTERNFANESGPDGKWHLLAPITIKKREAQGKWPGKLLQVDGSLASSVIYTVDDSSVTIQAGSGPSKDYAAIHQFGGMAGRGRKVKIPARPYLPLTGNSTNSRLAPEAALAVEEMAKDYLLAVLQRNA